MNDIQCTSRKKYGVSRTRFCIRLHMGFTSVKSYGFKTCCCFDIMTCLLIGVFFITTRAPFWNEPLCMCSKVRQYTYICMFRHFPVSVMPIPLSAARQYFGLRHAYTLVSVTPIIWSVSRLYSGFLQTNNFFLRHTSTLVSVTALLWSPSRQYLGLRHANTLVSVTPILWSPSRQFFGLCHANTLVSITYNTLVC